MAPKPTPTPKPGTPGTPPAPIDWGTLLPAVDAPVAVSLVGARFTLDSVPAPIRERMEASLAQTVQALKAAVQKGTDPKSVPPQWKLQPVSGQAMGDEFVKLARKYGQYRPEKEIPFYVAGSPTGQITVRAATVHYVNASGTVPEGAKPAPKDVSPGWYVRYAAKPLEGGKK